MVQLLAIYGRAGEMVLFSHIGSLSSLTSHYLALTGRRYCSRHFAVHAGSRDVGFRSMHGRLDFRVSGADLYSRRASGKTLSQGASLGNEPPDRYGHHLRAEERTVP